VTRTRRTTPLLVLAGVAFAAVAWRSMTSREPSRYEILQDRIERAMPRGRGEAAAPTVAAGPRVIASLSHVPDGEPGAGRAVVTVGGVRRVIPPLVRRADGTVDPASQAEVDAAYDAVAEAIRALQALSSDECGGEIRGSRDMPWAVAHRVAACFGRCGITDLAFLVAPADAPR
jgi:hypothetical protein